MDQLLTWAAAHSTAIYAGFGVVGFGVLAINVRDARARRVERDRRRAEQQAQRFGRPTVIEGPLK